MPFAFRRVEPISLARLYIVRHVLVIAQYYCITFYNIYTKCLFFFVFIFFCILLLLFKFCNFFLLVCCMSKIYLYINRFISVSYLSGFGFTLYPCLYIFCSFEIKYRSWYYLTNILHFAEVFNYFEITFLVFLFLFFIYGKVFFYHR